MIYVSRFILFVAFVFISTPVTWGGDEESNWNPHHVQQFTGQGDQTNLLSARLQIVTESERDRIVAVPYLVYMPEKDRLAMLVSCDTPHRPFLLFSDDHGSTWTAPKLAGLDARSLGLGLAYLGHGRLMFTTATRKHFSDDYGQTWDRSRPKPDFTDDIRANEWDPPLVDRDPKTGETIRIVSTAYIVGHHIEPDQAVLRTSSDLGENWSLNLVVPQWRGYNEVAFTRAANGDIVAALRTKLGVEHIGKVNIVPENDHYEGLGFSISKDNGQTWSEVELLYTFGRHHPSMVRLPNDHIVMTYVCRRGYPNDVGGYKQFGIEAIVSRDHGRTWDMEHRYILHKWSANRKGRDAWWASSQATSTVLLPDGSLLTAFGTGYRSQPGKQVASQSAPRDVGLVNWRVKF